MCQSRRLFALILLLAAVSTTWAFSRVSPEDAIDHVGKRAAVCGTVASANYAPGTNGQPTFLHLVRPYPNHVLNRPGFRGGSSS